MMMIADMLHDYLFYPDVDGMLLVRSNQVVAWIVVFYVLFVKYIGPWLMRNRKPMDLRFIIIAFNFTLVAVNVHLCINYASVARKYLKERCHLKYNSDFLGERKRIGYLAYQGLLLKMMELLDTVFFVLRKKSSQVSFLHVFHHSLVVMIVWIVIKTHEVGYYIIFASTINTAVHVVMYAYYLMSSFGPGVQKYLWWKRYLTVMQLGQFFVIAGYMVFAFMTGCEELGFYEKVCFVSLSIITALFLNFYAKAYGMPIDLEWKGQ